MQTRTVIRIKAIFLLAVFSLNSVLGFGCSIGLNLGYNKHHHSENQQHAHAIPTKHHHEMEGHHHEAANDDRDHINHNDPPAKADDCCKDGVLKFNLLDKSIVAPIKIYAPVQGALDIVALYSISALPIEDIPSNHYYVRSDHPPISTDIRTAIQSFQI